MHFSNYNYYFYIFYNYCSYYAVIFYFIVSMMVRIAFDIRYFIVVLCIMITGFTTSLWMISSPISGLPFSTIKNGFLNSFFAMLGYYNAEDFSGTISPELAAFLLVFFLSFMSILMFNLLIALMVESQRRVGAKALAYWRLEQATIILEEHWVSATRAQTPDSLHILKLETNDRRMPAIGGTNDHSQPHNSQGDSIWRRDLTSKYDAVNIKVAHNAEKLDLILQILNNNNHNNHHHRQQQQRESSGSNKPITIHDKVTAAANGVGLVPKSLPPL